MGWTKYLNLCGSDDDDDDACVAVVARSRSCEPGPPCARGCTSFEQEDGHNLNANGERRDDHKEMVKSGC